MPGPSVDPGTLPILPGAGVSCLGPLRSHVRGSCPSTLMCCIRAQFLWGQGPASSSSVLLQLLQTAPESLVQTTSLYQTDMAEACSPGSSDMPSCSLACLKHPPLPCINHQAVNSHPTPLSGPDFLSKQEGRPKSSPALQWDSQTNCVRPSLTSLPLNTPKSPTTAPSWLSEPGEHSL